jgi:minor extracellular serine protease Vpr
MRLRTARAARMCVLGVFAVAALAFTGVGGAVSDPELVPEGSVATTFVPRSLSSEKIVVVVQLQGSSVAEAQELADRELTDAERAAIESQREAEQAAIRAQIAAAGATILAQFQSALNGIKVEVARTDIGKLAALPGVKGILPVHEVVRENATSVPYIGAPSVWDPGPLPNLRGEGIKIGVIDTGIDYTHANFGGPGTVADFVAADLADTLPANPLYFGPLAPRIKGGFDLVGDDYNASGSGAELIPQPDPNPLDCDGHGSHVAGTAAGSGVTAAGATYAGPYNSGIYTPGAFTIGPGVAPKADIYGYRVFGCAGSTDVTVDAIDMAFADGMDVINMSLGSPFGSKNDASAIASDNAARAGMIVVASAGNEGANQYITGAPAAGTGAISVAANESKSTFPGFSMALSTGPITVLNANDATVADGTSYTVKRIVDDPATLTVDESLGCNVSDFGGPLAAGTMAVVVRGVCARVAKAIFGQQAGAAAVAMINTDSGFPPFEGPIFSNPDTGIPFTVTIPFLGVRGVLSSPTSDGSKLAAADGGTATLTNTPITNPNFTGFASFTSGGPRTGDSWLKPDITAPGVSIFSTGGGTGNLAAGISGTSMASPHVAGVAALVRQAHPTWTRVKFLKAAIVNTGLPSAIGGTAVYRTSRGGTGLVQPLAAVNTNVVATGDRTTGSLSYGFEELRADFSKSRTIELRNLGSAPATFNVTQTNAAGSPHSVVLDSGSVTVPARSERNFKVTLNVPVATAGDSNGPALSFREVAGLITFTPASAADNNDVTLRVPYYLVPRALSSVRVDMDRRVTTAAPSTNAKVLNPRGPITGDADFYAWGIQDARDPGLASNDVRGVGVQSFDCAAVFGAPTCTSFAADRFIVFAANTWHRWSNAATNEFDIFVDVDPANGNGDDYVVVGVDQGAVQAGVFNGRLAAFVFSLRSGGASLVFLATARTDSSTALLPIFNSQLCRAAEPCLSAASPRFSYHINSFDLVEETEDSVPGVAKFNAYSSSITQGDFVTVPVGGSAMVPITITPTEWALTPALGVMVVSLDNRAGRDETELLPLRLN